MKKVLLTTALAASFIAGASVAAENVANSFQLAGVVDDAKTTYNDVKASAAEKAARTADSLDKTAHDKARSARADAERAHRVKAEHDAEHNARVEAAKAADAARAAEARRKAGY